MIALYIGCKVKNIISKTNKEKPQDVPRVFG